MVFSKAPCSQKNFEIMFEVESFGQKQDCVCWKIFKFLNLGIASNAPFYNHGIGKHVLKYNNRTIL